MNAQSSPLPAAIGSRPLASHRFFKQQLTLIGLIVGVRLVTLYALPEEIGPSAKISGLQLSDQIGAWKGRNVKVDPFVYQELHPDAVVQKRFALTDSGASRPPQIEVLVMYTRDTEGFHPPDVCMKAQGWVIGGIEHREVKSGNRVLPLEVVTGEQREQRKTLAYIFSDATGAVSGRTATFANMVFARFLRRRIGALEIQFAYGPDALTPDGDFSPPFKALMVQTADEVYAQLKAQTSKKAA